jgi:hypothetical protein
MGRPTKRKDGVPMTGAEREARRRKRIGKTLNRRRRTARRLAKQNTEAKLRREASRNTPPLPDGAEYRIGDCRTVFDDPASPHYIADNTVAMILTDPPWQGEGLRLCEWLAPFAARVLIPGGALICYVGHALLDQVLAILGQHLRYHWLCTMRLGASQLVPGKNILACNRPILFYSKGTLRPKLTMSDEFISPNPEKFAHAWAQRARAASGCRSSATPCRAS